MLSDHFDGKIFFNPGVRAERGLLDVLRWQLTSKRAPWPRWIKIAPPPLPAAPLDDGVTATWINHSTFLLQTAHGNLLTDPVFSERCSPVSWLGPRRVHAPGVAFEALPPISAVLLSHDHYDHCDLPSLRRLAKVHAPQFIVPLGHAALLDVAGEARVIELDWWQTHSPWAGCAVTLTPSLHWCRRRIGGTNQRLWGGFHLETGGRKLWFVGDSAYDAERFREIRRRCGVPDLAFIPIGAYEPRWFMRSAHMNPAEAVQAHLDSGARRSVAMHWGAFQLTDEGRDEPPAALERARAAAGIEPEAFQVLAPGASVVA